MLVDRRSSHHPDAPGRPDLVRDRLVVDLNDKATHLVAENAGAALDRAVRCAVFRDRLVAPASHIPMPLR